MNTETSAPTVYAAWMGAESLSTFLWPQGCKDNRLSRVRGRIERYGIETPMEGTLRIFKTREGAESYIDALRAEHGV